MSTPPTSSQPCPSCGGTGTVQMTAVITSPGDGKSYLGLTTSACGTCGGTGRR